MVKHKTWHHIYPDVTIIFHPGENYILLYTIIYLQYLYMILHADLRNLDMVPDFTIWLFNKAMENPW